MKTSITLNELKDMIMSNLPLMILDVRSKEEYTESHIPSASNLPLKIIEEVGFLPEPGKIVITICSKGAGRSERAASELRVQFNSEVYFLEGGTLGWNEQLNGY